MTNEPADTAYLESAGHEPESTDPLVAWDEERRRCPVAKQGGASRKTEWVVYGHPEALVVLEDHRTFSSRVSRHLSVPSGIDPPEHAPYRAIVERYFEPAVMAAFEPTCRAIVAEVIEAAITTGAVDAQRDLGEPCAVRMQCAFMGWPVEMRERLTAWQDANERATRSREPEANAAVAKEFGQRVEGILARRRAAGESAPNDPTTRLLRERVEGRPLTDPELVSIIRNWTVGELGSIASSVGILMHDLAKHRVLQERLRADPDAIAASVDEMLRARGPLVSNRRVATRDCELGGRRIARGDHLHILWPSVDRDERVFTDPTALRPDREPVTNLLYGAGIHVCPGAPLARLELRVFTEELLSRCAAVQLDPTRRPTFARPPKGGFETVPVLLTR